MKKFLSLVLALVMTMSLVTISAGAKDFTDDSTIEYDEAVDVISAIGVVDGYADGAFKPTATLTRGAAAKIICNLILGPTTAAALSADAAPYSDVPANHTFAGYIAYCAKEGIISGYADGTFRPAGTLTGYAFMKMLLGALGYDASIEGYTGSNWSIAVAKRAINIGLDDGNDDFVGTKAVTREEACLYAFNTLKADMVEYKDKSSIVIGDVSIVTSADAKETGETFADTYFSKLKIAPTKDDFGRPATKWTWKSKEVGTYADDADASYSAKVKMKTIYADLGLDENIYAEDVDLIVDGADATMAYDICEKGTQADKKIGANGVLTEVFLQKNKDDAIIGATVIQINTHVGEVTDVDENDDDERYIEIDKDLQYVTEEFEDDDIVLYTAVDEDVQSVALTEKLEGKLTKVSGEKYTIDGETYELSANAEIDEDVDVKDEVEFYLDAYGYLIKVDPVDDDVTVDDLAYVLNYKSDDFDGDRAKLLFADGTKKTVDVDEDDSDTVKTGDIVSFKVDDDEYELTVEAQTSGSVTKGSPKFASGVVANSKTAYVYYLDGGDTIDTYTSYKNAPTVNAGKAVAYVDDGKAVVVFVIADEDDVDSSTSSDDVTYIAVEAGADITDDGDNTYYTFSAVVDGEVTELDIDAKLITASEDCVIAFESVTTKDGIVTALKKAVELNSAASVSVKNEVITLGSTAYAYDDDVLVLFVDDNEFSVGAIESIKDKAGTYSAIQFTLNDDGDVDAIILTKA